MRAVTLGLCRLLQEVLPECRLSVVYDDGSVIEKIGRCKMGLLSSCVTKGVRMTHVPCLEMACI